MSIMKITSLKPKQKLINLRRCKLLIHAQAKTPFIIWDKFRNANSIIDFKGLDKFYLPPLRLIEADCGKLFFINDFNRFYELELLKNIDYYPCLITPESKKDIQTLAWLEIIKLANQKNINHPNLFKTIKKKAPESIICELMQIKRLTIENYCRFVNIKKSSFEYQQSRESIEESIIGLPSNMDWIEE